MDRISWEEYYMQMAILVSKRSSCLRRQVGSVLVKDNRVISTGYNGSPSGITNCYERGYCIREKAEQGMNLDMCYAQHSEMNCISVCAKQGISCEGATLYVTLSPCFECAKMIIQAGIKRVCYGEKYRDLSGIDFLIKNNIEVEYIQI